METVVFEPKLTQILDFESVMLQ